MQFYGRNSCNIFKLFHRIWQLFKSFLHQVFPFFNPSFPGASNFAFLSHEKPIITVAGEWFIGFFVCWEMRCEIPPPLCSARLKDVSLGYLLHHMNGALSSPEGWEVPLKRCLWVLGSSWGATEPEWGGLALYKPRLSSLLERFIISESIPVVEKERLKCGFFFLGWAVWAVIFVHCTGC